MIGNAVQSSKRHNVSNTHHVNNHEEMEALDMDEENNSFLDYNTNSGLSNKGVASISKAE